MKDQVFNIADAKAHLSRLIERVERGEQITIARNHRPVAILSPAQRSPEAIVAQVRAVRNAIHERNRGRKVLRRGETWRRFVDAGRRI